MPDPYATIADADLSLQEHLSEVLELRASDPQQQAMLGAYLSEIDLPPGARALEVGCGTSAVSRALVESRHFEVTGVDLSPVFVARARELGRHLAGLAFLQGDGRSLPLPDASYDLVVFHTTLCHIPDPETALREAHRVLRPNGWLAIFDGDYTTTTVAISDFDPLQPLVNAMVANFVHNPGWRDGADILSGSASLSAEAADALRNEARRRARAGEFFGHISFVSVIARKLSDVAPGNPAQPMSRVGARGQ